MLNHLVSGMKAPRYIANLAKVALVPTIISSKKIVQLETLLSIHILTPSQSLNIRLKLYQEAVVGIWDGEENWKGYAVLIEKIQAPISKVRF